MSAQQPVGDRRREQSPRAAQALRPFVLYFGRLGDMIMLTALLQRLHGRYGLPSYLVGGGSWNEAVYRGNPDVAGFWSFGRHFPFALSAAWPQVRRALRAAAPGPVYVCEKHYRQLPRIRRMLAFSGIDAARVLYLSDEPAEAGVPPFERLLRLGTRTPAALCAQDYPLRESDRPLGPRLFVQDAERRERDDWLRERGWSGRELILVQPGSHRTMSHRRGRWRRTGADDKAWPLERWVTLLHEVRGRLPQALLVLRGAKEEVPMLREIQAAAALPEVVIAGAELRELFALCEAAHSMISVDTGPAHAAAALGLPLVVLYVAPDWLQWLPRTPSGSAVLPVVGRGRVDQISVDQVFDTWSTLLQQR